MQVRFANGRVVEVAYSGDTDMAGFQHAYCASLIKNCARYSPTPQSVPTQPPLPIQTMPPMPAETTQTLPPKP